MLLFALVLWAAAAQSGEILEPVRIPNPNGAALDGLLSKPEGPGPFPAVVLLHGCSGMRTGDGRLNARQRQWDKTLRGKGFVTLHVDSFGSRGLRQVCTLKVRPVSVWKDRRQDAYAALSWLRALPFVRPDGIAVMGWSQGGLVVLAAMERDETTPPDGFGAGVAVYPACRSSERESLSPSGPLLLLLGEADDWTPPERCDPVIADAERRGETVEVKRYPGAFHSFDWPGSKVRVRTGLALAPGGAAHIGENPAARLDALDRVPEFLRRHLPGPATESLPAGRPSKNATGNESPPGTE